MSQSEMTSSLQDECIKKGALEWQTPNSTTNVVVIKK